MLEFLLLSTVLIVDRGLIESTMNNPLANIPSIDLTCAIDLFVNDRYVHRLIVMADSATTVL